MRHMLMQISPLGDLVRQVISGLCRAASRGAPGRRTSGGKSKYSETTRRLTGHSLSVTNTPYVPGDFMYTAATWRGMCLDVREECYDADSRSRRTRAVF